MQWTAEQYIRRVLVEVAARTRRGAWEVAEDPFALTLWTWAELQEIDREASVTRLGERLDLAGMVAIGINDPASLRHQELRYFKAAGQLSRMMDDARSRAQAMIERAKGGRIVATVKPPRLAR